MKATVGTQQRPVLRDARCHAVAPCWPSTTANAGLVWRWANWAWALLIPYKPFMPNPIVRGWSRSAALIHEWSPVLVIVGLPSHMDDTEHALSARCRRFALQLSKRFGVQTRLVDERLTSRAAGESLAAGRDSRPSPKGPIGPGRCSTHPANLFLGAR